MRYEPLTDIAEAAAFIARLNARPECHIGYCSTNAAEVAQAMATEIDSPPAQEAFFTLRNGAGIQGLLGFDGDASTGTAELWGPFVEPSLQANAWAATADTLFKACLEALPNDLHTLQLFPQVHNTRCAEFARQHGFEVTSEQAVLGFTRADLARLGASVAQPLQPEHARSLQRLHDQLWPGTYLSGQAILERLDAQHPAPQHQVLTVQADGELLGYVYAEAEPAFGEGSIEFIGVHPGARGRGLGNELLTGALHWLFSFPATQEITLCVNAAEHAALGLYRKAGFTVRHRLQAYRKRLG